MVQALNGYLKGIYRVIQHSPRKAGQIQWYNWPL